MKRAQDLVESMLVSIREGGPPPELLLADAERAQEARRESEGEASAEASDSEPAPSPSPGKSVPILKGDDELDLEKMSRTPGQLPYLQALQKSPIVLAAAGFRWVQRTERSQGFGRRATMGSK